MRRQDFSLFTPSSTHTAQSTSITEHLKPSAAAQRSKHRAVLVPGGAAH